MAPVSCRSLLGWSQLSPQPSRGRILDGSHCSQGPRNQPLPLLLLLSLPGSVISCCFLHIETTGRDKGLRVWLLTESWQHSAKYFILLPLSSQAAYTKFLLLGKGLVWAAGIVAGWNISKSWTKEAFCGRSPAALCQQHKVWRTPLKAIPAQGQPGLLQYPNIFQAFGLALSLTLERQVHISTIQFLAGLLCLTTNSPGDSTTLRCNLQ